MPTAAVHPKVHVRGVVAGGLPAFDPQRGTRARKADAGLAAFPRAEVTFQPHQKRQQIVDSWPADVDDSAARRDWDFAPRFDEERAFTEYLVPTIRHQYKTAAESNR